MISALERGRAAIETYVEKERRNRNVPAYSRSIAEARKAGLMPKSRMVFALLDWDLKPNYPRIVISRDADFDKIDWGFLSGLDVVIRFHSHDEPLVEPLARAIMKANPRRLQAWPLDPDDEGRYPTRFFRVADEGGHHG